jgi:hypothetical protein
MEDTSQAGVVVTDETGQRAIAVPNTQAVALIEPVTLNQGERIGDCRLVTLSDNVVELRTPGNLGWGLGLLGAAPIVWCLLAWALCLKEGLLSERLPACLVLTVMAIFSVVLMISCLATDWRFDGRTQQIDWRVGTFVKKYNAGQIVGLKLETTRVGVASFADQRLFMHVVDAAGKTVLDVGEWNRREVDRVKVEALAAAIRKVMGWQEPVSN